MIIRFLGYATFEIVTQNNKKIIIDPFLEKNPNSPKKLEDFDKLDFILVSHGSYSHYGDTLELAKKTGAKVICGPEVKTVLVDGGLSSEQITILAWGITIESEGVIIRAVKSTHQSNIIRQNGEFLTGFPLGFIIDDGKTKLYNSSDTALSYDMKVIRDFNKPDIGILNVSTGDYVYEADGPHPSPYITGEMTGEEAAIAAKWLGLKYAIPCHFEDENDKNKLEFISILEKEKGKPKVIVLKPGEEFKYTE